MSGITDSVRVAAIIKETLLGRTCHLTSGQPTRMPMSTFKRMCQVKQDEAGTYGYEGRLRPCNVTVGKCATCKGKEIPDEIEIIPLEEVALMGTGQAGLSKCGLCGKKTTLRNNHDLMVCGTCQSLQARISLQPEVVVKALQLMHPEVLGGLVKGGGADDANRLLMDIRNVFGVTDAAFDIVAAVSGAVQELIQCRQRTEALVSENSILADRVSVLGVEQELNEKFVADLSDVLQLQGLRPVSELTDRVKELRGVAGYYADSPLRGNMMIANHVAQDGSCVEISLGGVSVKISGIRENVQVEG